MMEIVIVNGLLVAKMNMVFEMDIKESLTFEHYI
jgi:hypothetical protein